MVGNSDTPNVETALSAWHIAGEVKPIAVGRYCGMGIAGEGVLADLQQLWRAPGSITSGTSEYLSIAGVVRIVGATCQIHRLAVGREAAGSLFVFAVEFAFCRLGLFPFAFVVFSGEKDISTLSTRNTAYLVALGVVTGRSKVKHIAVIAQKSGTEVAPSAGQDGLFLDAVERELLFPFRSKFASLQSIKC